MSRLAAIISAVVICLIVSLGWLASHYHDNATEFKRQRDKVTEQLSLAKDTIADMQTRQRDVAALDAKYTKELADAKAENDALQRKLDNGGRVLVKGKCPVSAATQAAGAASMGDDATVELCSCWTKRSRYPVRNPQRPNSPESAAGIHPHAVFEIRHSLNACDNVSPCTNQAGKK